MLLAMVRQELIGMGCQSIAWTTQGRTTHISHTGPTHTAHPTHAGVLTHVRTHDWPPAKSVNRSARGTVWPHLGRAALR